ncbi:unnamed protein product [Staurois parvus]|uniref:Uncharacterized protein n=1 Tax=Staurois parvus TaxID=386267 RepID=A0ABN9C203_9NEOB|nr:unnamed protein product [Staurois parvus]
MFNGTVLRFCKTLWKTLGVNQGRADHLSTRALPEGLGSVGGPIRCPWYLS